MLCIAPGTVIDTPRSTIMRLTTFVALLLSMHLHIRVTDADTEPLPCSCDANRENPSCDKWCGPECLRYLREELLIMDLVDCLNSTVETPCTLPSRQRSWTVLTSHVQTVHTELVA